MDHTTFEKPGKIQSNIELGSKGRKFECHSSGFEANTYRNSHTHETEGHVGNKNLQTEVKKIQEESQTKQAQLEPLQEKVEKIITKLETEKARMEHVHSESIQVLTEHVTMQAVETLADKNAQEKNQLDDLAKKFRELEKSLYKAHTT